MMKKNWGVTRPIFEKIGIFQKVLVELTPEIANFLDTGRIAHPALSTSAFLVYGFYCNFDKPA